MTLRTIIAAFAASVAVAAPAAAEEQVYYCSSELGTGITKDEQTGRWRTGTFGNIRFTMKFGERTKGYVFYDRDLVLSLDGDQQHFVCNLRGSINRCVEMLPASIEPFFADDPNSASGTDLISSFLITDLKRFELYHGSSFGFVKDSGDNSAMFAGTCETF